MTRASGVWGKALVSALLLSAHGAAPRSARAFSDPLTFADDVALGGGGGRYFTGSAADGYGCDVCHHGAPSPTLQIIGLPLAGYRPGGAYEVQVEWPRSIEHMALALEITDSAGRGAGSLELPPLAELPNPERCEPVEDGLAAGELYPLEDGRTILNVADCGAKRVRFLWTAPIESREALRLSGGLVASDTNADAAGDGTTMFAHVLAPEHANDPLASDIRTSCSIGRGVGYRVRPSRATSTFACGLAAVAIVVARRARRRRSWR